MLKFFQPHEPVSERYRLAPLQRPAQELPLTPEQLRALARHEGSQAPARGAPTAPALPHPRRTRAGMHAAPAALSPGRLQGWRCP